MATCEDIPTLADTQEAKRNMDTITEFVESSDPTLTDQYGDVRKTLQGVIDAKGSLYDVTGDGAIRDTDEKAYIRCTGLSTNPLAGIVISTLNAGGKYTLLLIDTIDNSVYFYTTGNGDPSLFNGTLIPTSFSNNLGGYFEKVGNDVSAVDVSSYNVVKQALGSPETIGFVNLPSDLLANGLCYSCAFQITDGSGGNVIGFPPMTKYAGKVKPDLTLNGVDEFYLRTFGEQVADPAQGGVLVAQWYLSFIQDFGVPA